jgi:prepilin-type N-terminal cleavage/methylation domain-containing protein
MKKQAGFTLIELAIVLVIIGLLLGGVLRGQELINSARVKNLTRDFQNIQVFLYGYQDRFRAIPGDDGNAAARLPGPPAAINAPAGNANNGLINGQWNSANPADESFLFWQHVRLAGLAPGPVDIGNPTFQPRNSNNGRIGIQSIGANFTKIGDMQGAYAICSDLILGRDALQIDTTLDDGDTATGNIRVGTAGADGNSLATAVVTANQANQYTVCMSL